VRGWWLTLSAVALALVMANPLCVCHGTSIDVAVPGGGCCDSPGEGVPAPVSPCDCLPDPEEGLAEKPGDSTKSVGEMAKAHDSAQHGMIAAPRVFVPLRSAEFHDPPLRHLFSVYRL
tara:strand:- start:2748 stop:3101 length:354 start_codon:yes stop_codon:yes gene_type:complete